MRFLLITFLLPAFVLLVLPSLCGSEDLAHRDVAFIGYSERKKGATDPDKFHRFVIKTKYGEVRFPAAHKTYLESVPVLADMCPLRPLEAGLAGRRAGTAYVAWCMCCTVHA